MAEGYVELLKRYINIKKKLDETVAEEARLKQDLIDVEQEAIEAMVEADVCTTGVSTPDGKVSFTLSHKVHFKPKRKTEDMFKALEALGHGDLVKVDVNTRSFGARMRELFEMSKETVDEIPDDKTELLPEGIRDYVSIYEEDKLSVRGLK